MKIVKGSDLHMWLLSVWQKAQRTGKPVPLDDIYAEYEQMIDPVQRTFTAGRVEEGETDYPDQFFEMTPADPQFPVGADDSPVNDVRDDPLALGGENTGAGYLYVKSPTFKELVSKRRIVLHIRPYNRLIKAMRLIVRDIVKAGGRFADVNGAKVMTPACFQSGRNDTLIIYVKTLKTTKAVLHQLMSWIAEGLLPTNNFVVVLPKTIQSVCKGIGYACEPPRMTILNSYRRVSSYGRFLSQIIYIAIDVALAMSSDRGINRKFEADDYLLVAAQVFLKAGINPATPYEFGAMAAVFNRCLPWMEGSSIVVRQTALYDSVLGELKRQYGWW